LEEYVVRPWQPTDIPDLREIFTASCGDSPEEVDTFFRAFLTGPEACTVVAVPEEGRPEGRPVAAGYCVAGIGLQYSARKQVPAEYLYALGCLPARRGHGFGMKLHELMFSGGGKPGVLRCMIPVSEGLLQAYRRISMPVPLGRIRTAEIRREEITATPPAAETLSPEEYARRREKMLAPWPHAAYPAAWFSLMAEYNDVFLAMPGAQAAVIPMEGYCIVAELLCPGADPAGALAGVAAACPAERYRVRTPAFFPGPGSLRPFAYCAGEAEAPPEDFWFPFGLE